MNTSTVTQKGQIVVPAKIRKSFGIKKGTKIAFVVQNGNLILLPVRKEYFNSLKGILGTKGKILKSLKEDKKIERKL